MLNVLDLLERVTPLMLVLSSFSLLVSLPFSMLPPFHGYL
jgi:hypothetical protein